MFMTWQRTDLMKLLDYRCPQDGAFGALDIAVLAGGAGCWPARARVKLRLLALEPWNIHYDVGNITASVQKWECHKQAAFAIGRQAAVSICSINRYVVYFDKVTDCICTLKSTGRWSLYNPGSADSLLLIEESSLLIQPGKFLSWRMLVCNSSIPND